MSTATPGAPPRPIIDPQSTDFDELLDRIAEGAERRERTREAPFEVIGWIKDAGLGRLRVPRDEGGAGQSIPDFFRTVIRLARADSNVAHIIRAHYWFVEQQLQTNDPDARARGLAIVASNALVGNGFSEQSSRSTGLEFDTAFTPDGDGHRLNGQKFYSTGTIYSDYTQIWASAPNGRIAGAVIPVDREGVTVDNDWDGFGQRLTGTGTTRLDNVWVTPEEYFDLGDPHGEQPPSYQGAFLQLYLQALTAGVLHAVADDAVALARRRVRNSAMPPSPETEPLRRWSAQRTTHRCSR